MTEDEDPSSRHDRSAHSPEPDDLRSTGIPKAVIGVLVLVAIFAALFFVRGPMRGLSGILLGGSVGFLFGLRAGDRSTLQPRHLQPLSDRVREIARDPDRKIEAIRIYREETGANLGEGRDAVEAYIDSL